MTEEIVHPELGKPNYRYRYHTVDQLIMHMANMDEQYNHVVSWYGNEQEFVVGVFMPRYNETMSVAVDIPDGPAVEACIEEVLKPRVKRWYGLE